MVSNQDRPYRDDEWLREKYIGESKDSDEIAGMCGVTRDTIQRWLNRHGIESGRSMVELECLQCGGVFRVREVESDRKYCSGECRAEGQSRRVEVDCHTCGDSVLRKPSVAEKRDRSFCSRECMSEWQSSVFSGEGNPSWDGGKVELECAYCGDSFHLYPSQTGRGRGRFCSRSCYESWFSETLSGEDSPHWTREKRECYTCGESTDVPQHKLDNERHFCSQECAMDWFADAFKGEDSPHWKGGEAEHPEYGREWESIREEALERDGYRCQECGVSGEELQYPLHVHHKTPVREFDSLEDAHEMDNLVSLCPSCHMKREKSVTESLAG